MKTKFINPAYVSGFAIIFFAVSFAIASAQTLNRPLLGPDPHSGTNEKPERLDSEKKDKPGFVGKLQDARKDTKEAQAQIRDNLKNKLKSAEDNDARKDILENARVNRRSSIDEFKSRRADIRAEAKTEVGSRIKRHLENIFNRLDKAGQKFANILDRISAHIGKLKERGADVTNAEAALLVAENSVNDAAADIGAAQALFEGALESDTPREFLDEIKEAVRTAAASIKEAHRAVNAAIKELKEAARALKASSADNDSQSVVDSDDDSNTE